MAYQAIVNLPFLFHHPVVNDDTKSEFPVEPEFIAQYGKEIGGCWTCYCPDGQVTRLRFCQGGPNLSFVGGPNWTEMKKKFGIRHGQTVDFYYLGGQRFKLTIDGWNGVVFPHVTEEDDAAYFDEEDEEDANEAHDTAAKTGGNDRMEQGQCSGNA
ncbi:hypothetical protein RIF29_09006 [Crotalaria pallida]|uniref:Uncharacterized protein n=1 Tax=Crotalaria pallida TaxID=3830 RepID=A0AAN9FRG3_CROPI